MQPTFLQQLLNVLQIILITSTILTPFILWLRKRVFKPFNQTMKKVDNLSTNFDSISAQIVPVVTSLQREFEINSGKSIKDRITRIDETVQLAELRSKLVAANMPIGVYECNPQGEWIWVNKSLCDLFGIDSNEMMGRGWLLGVDPEERGEVWSKWISDITSDIPYEHEYTARNTETGEKFIVRSVVVAHRATGSHSILGYHGTITRID